MNTMAISLVLAFLASTQLCFVSGGTTTQIDCIEASIPDIYGIGECLKGDMYLCSGDKNLTTGLRALINCSAQGVMKNLTPRNALVVAQKLAAVAVRKVPILRFFLGWFIPQEFDSSINQASSICQGAINIGFPGSIGKCLKNTLMTCNNGSVVDVPFLQSLSSAGECVFFYLLTTAPLTVFMNIACDISNSAATVFGPRNGITSLLSMTCFMK
ncbi:hypothetical protein V5799_006516 [Amblyomma americanum]|uniref:Secreted protein n=1 Tax=Amblyomma americanum TaxID=6943 RepID=A0AAQ4DW58_AMBAM